jgi:hypothetical protein
MNLNKLLAVALVAAAPVSANAVPISQLDVVGNLNPSTSEYSSTGQIDFIGVGTATSATGIFADVVTIEEALDNPPFDPTVFDLFDFEFDDDTPVLVFSGGGFSLFVTQFVSFDNELPGRAFSATGFVAGPSGDLQAQFSLSTQVNDLDETLVSFSSTATAIIPVPASVLMLLASLAGLGLIGYRRKAEAA